MTLLEMAAEYRQNVAVLRQRSLLLRERLRVCEDPLEQAALSQRIRDLGTLCREGREIARIMERYYERRPGHAGV